MIKSLINNEPGKNISFLIQLKKLFSHKKETEIHPLFVNINLMRVEIGRLQNSIYLRKLKNRRCTKTNGTGYIRTMEKLDIIIKTIENFQSRRKQ